MPTSKSFRMSSWLVLSLCLICSTLMSAQSTGGRILGRVSDSSGAVLANVKVTATNEATGIARETNTNASGDYVFPEVPVGTYTLTFDLSGFKTNVRKGVALDLNQVINVNISMQVGASKEVVEVTSEAPLVDTTTTQLGAVADARSVTQLPLNARDTYQFLQLQPGVMSTVGSSNTIVYGSDKTGAVSVNGGRGRSNNFSVNGGDANDQFVNLPTVQPSPDSIEEFRVLTNTFDAEYGRNSGSVVNVVTKSGTNNLHGNLFEFFRNTLLNGDGYCLAEASGVPCEEPKSNQNQFGGTLGGPIKKDRTFFFTSYEGRRIRQGIPSPLVTVPTDVQRPDPTRTLNGHIVADFSKLPDGTAAPPFGGTLTNSYALLPGNQPNQIRPNCQQAVTDIGGGSIFDGANYSDIFPGNQIPLECMDPTAVDLLLKYVPTPANGSDALETAPVQPERGDQFTVKFDHRINDKQNLSIYYYFDDHHVISPFAQFQAAGANVPGFGSITNERFQQWNISHTWTISNTTVNEFRFNYNREAQRTFQRPVLTSTVQDSCPPAPSWLTAAFNNSPVPCFSDGTQANALGIHPNLGAQFEGVPFIQVSGGFTIGNNGEGSVPQVGNSFQWSDSVSKIVGNHSIKFGGDVRRQRFDQTLYFDVNGEFFVDGTSTNTVGADTVFPDYLLGFPGSYGQGSAQVENVRSTALYLFAQDSWKIKPNLTLNYGLRWELNTPIADVSKHVQTFRPGQVSTVFPCGGPNTDCSSMTPVGLVVPGDAGVSNGLTQTYYKAFAPRIGIAWSPGNSGKTSIRAGWGLFYNPIEQLVLEQFSAEPPFGGSTFPFNTFFNTPFLDQSGGFSYPNPFGLPSLSGVNGILNPKRGQPVDWGMFRPILLFGQFQPKMRSQYSAQYNLTIERELARDLKLQVGYVGSQGHRLLATHDLNFGNPQTCLDLNAVLGDGTCGPYFADSAFSIPAGTVLPVDFHLPYAQNNSVIPAGTTLTNGLTLVGLRRYSSPQCDPLTGNGCPGDGIPVFSSIFAQDTIANSAYNSLQASLDKRFAHGLQFTAAYTFSKSFDEASSFEGILNPIDPRISRSLSVFDARHRIVFSYYWELPFQHYNGAKGKLLNGWAVSGITTFQTGFPIRITSAADNELMYSFDFELPGEPAQIAPFHTQKAQSHDNYFFDPNSFTENATVAPTATNGITNCSAGAVFGCYDPALFGTLGTAKRTICCGPHISQTDFAILKTISLTETKHLDFRAEFFNIFNHTQFFNPDGNTTDGSQFGQVTQVRDPRELQFALKFFF